METSGSRKRCRRGPCPTALVIPGKMRSNRKGGGALRQKGYLKLPPTRLTRCMSHIDTFGLQMGYAVPVCAGFLHVGGRPGARHGCLAGFMPHLSLSPLMQSPAPPPRPPSSRILLPPTGLSFCLSSDASFRLRLNARVIARPVCFSSPLTPTPR